MRAPRLGGRPRVYGLLFAVTLLCGLAYLAGIWTGMQTSVTCTTVAQGQIVCGTDGLPPAPALPPAPPERGSA